MLPPFQNEACTDFSDPHAVAAFQDALDRARAESGATLPLVIAGERMAPAKTFPTLCPSRPTEVLAQCADGDAHHADRAMEAAAAAFEDWRRVPAVERARLLLRVAADMRRRRHEFSALMTLEAGKPWSEADGDTAEAIDFLEYYARRMLALDDSSDQLGAWPGETQTLRYIPLGVGAVIPPWNFPTAIPTGLTGATLVAGNSAVLKPAEQTPLIGYRVAELFWENGLPPGVLNFLTGPGEVVGARMVRHPRTRLVSFTGSREVGIDIYEHAARVQPGQRWLKRAILEMGGKNAILVDESADLAAAAQGIVTSAFGFQGQKCSASSRVIVVAAVYEELTERVVALAQDLVVGAPDEGPHVQVGPLVDADALRKVSGYLRIGRDEGRLLCGGAPLQTEAGGYFVPPTVFGDVTPAARIAREEIFGPVTAFMRAHDFGQALEMANAVEYGLTGAVFSRDPANLARAREDFHVGNLYLNRKSTGAMVGVQPFGGFNMSGTDSKAGGPDYLLLFTQAKSIAEQL